MWNFTKTIILIVPFLAVFNASNLSLDFRNKREVRSSIILHEPSCAIVKQLCPSPSNSDIEILECLQGNPNYMNRLDVNCQHAVWNATTQVIGNENVHYVLSRSECDAEEPLGKCSQDTTPGSFLKCAIKAKDEIVNKHCLAAVNRLENIAFDDLKWISSFLTHCSDDVEKLKCGRLTGDNMSQGETLACLQNRYRDVDQECQKEILALSEIQSDNIMLDRQLYMACAMDQMKYCKQFSPGSGRVFKCLMQHYDEKFEQKCREHLLRRQKLISEDYKVSKGLMKACRDDIKKFHCRKQTSDDKSIRLAQILLCLENVVKYNNGTKLDPDCEVEMRDHRRILMEDYRLSPEIVEGCSIEIRKYCVNLETGGKTLHCLMDHARVKNAKKKIRDTCQRALEQLIKETDAAEDWRVDPVLHEACYPVVRVACKDLIGGDAKVMNCLMDNIGDEVMTDECEDALIQIQYFVARDFKLDAQLYKACREDASNICHATKDWEDPNNQPDNGPIVLPCLYRYANHPEKENRLKPKCYDQIKRVMRQRALSVDLNPKIEEDCLDDLALFCFDKTERGEELACLQTNLDKVQEACRRTIEDYTELEAEHVELNPYIMRNCKEAMRTLCRDEMQSENGDVTSCLITHKNDPAVRGNAKCKVSVDHFQLISLKDFRFSRKFKEACKRYAMQFCQNEKTKAGVVACLSQKVVNDTMAGIKSDIQKECRQQLRAQLFQQRESVKYDPVLLKACLVDIKRVCDKVPQESAQVLECLQSNTKELSDACQVELFKVKKEETVDNSVDYALMTSCADTIDQFCPKADRERVLDCLKEKRNEKGFSKKCKEIVLHRMIEQNSDYRLNPDLHENCVLDISAHCKHVVAKEGEKELNGQVIKCLRDAFRHFKLTPMCEREMTSVIKQQALDLRLNPLLRVVCKTELSTICATGEDDEAGKAEECLKDAFMKKNIPTKECQDEVVYLIEESKADINADPLLQQACALDLLTYCNDVPQGNGRHIRCLKLILANSDRRLSPDCAQMFKTRVEMYKQADKNVPEDLQQLYNEVVTSPAKHYFFFILFMVIGAIFIIGMFCGRAMHRHMLLKNK